MWAGVLGARGGELVSTSAGFSRTRPRPEQVPAHRALGSGKLTPGRGLHRRALELLLSQQ